jgi:hypothetical protein
LYGPEKVERTTKDLLRSVAPGDNFLLGLTEDIPSEFLEGSLRAITETVMKHGKYPIKIS